MPQQQTVCAGRFRLYVPGPLEGGGFRESSFNSLSLGLQAPEPGKDLANAWRQRVDKLRTEQGDAFGANGRPVKDYTLDGRHAVFFRFAPNDPSYTLETWTPFKDETLVSSFDGREGDLPAIERLTLNVVSHFVPSIDRQLPATAFCVQGGAVDLAPDQGEQVEGSWTLVDAYDLDFRTAVVTSPPKITLVDEAKKTLAKSLVTPGAHFTLTRAGDRAVLGMNGQEAVSSFHNDPSFTNFYTADFAFGGVPNKGSKPALRLTLKAYDRPGKKVDARQFLSTWDEILKTLEVRLRD